MGKSMGGMVASFQMPDMSFRIETVTIPPGGMLLTYTDGLPDAMDSERRFFGQGNVERLFLAGAGSAEAMVTRLGLSVQEHIADADQFDDVTFMVVRRAA
jgi:serine phosphatase RsbU (regulator of sigma subunit)